MPRYDYVLFDADNTLFDFDAAERRALKRTLEERGYPFNAETEGCYQAINVDLWSRLDRGEVTREYLVVERFAAFTRAMGGAHDPAAFNRDYLNHLAEGADLLPGAEALCRALAPHCTLAIVTNGVAGAQRGRFGRSPLKELIPWLFISEEVGWSKPRVEFFDRVLHDMEIPDKRRAVVVGDNLISDIGGGNAAGLDTIWYNPGALPRESGGTPTWEARSFERVMQIILSPPAAGAG